MARKYEFVPQSAGKEGEVICKQVKFFPKEKKGKDGKRTVEGFGVLHFPCFRIKLTPASGVGKAKDENDLCNLTTLRWSKPTSSGPEGTFSLEPPGTMSRPLLKDSNGRAITRVRKGMTMTFPDLLAPEEYKPAEREKFHKVDDFKARLVRIVGKEMSDTIIALFADEIVAYAQKLSEKQQAARKSA